jgi:DnaA N-terminal domain
MSEINLKDIMQELQSLRQENKYLRNLLDVTLDKVVQMERRINRFEGNLISNHTDSFLKNDSTSCSNEKIKYDFEQIDGSARELIKSLFNEVAKQISAPSFYTWFADTIMNARLTEDMLMIYAKHEFGRDWLEARYGGLIHEIITKILQKDVQIRYVCE